MKRERRKKRERDDGEVASVAAPVFGKAERSVMLAGKKYLLTRPSTIGTSIDIDAYVRMRKVAPVFEHAAMACKVAPGESHAAIWTAAMERAEKLQLVSKEDREAFCRADPLRATAFMLYQALDRRYTEEMSLEDGVEFALSLIRADNGKHLHELRAVTQFVSQSSELKNLSGRSTAPVPTSATAGRSMADGPESLSISPSDLAGTPSK